MADHIMAATNPIMPATHCVGRAPRRQPGRSASSLTTVTFPAANMTQTSPLSRSIFAFPPALLDAPHFSRHDDEASSARPSFGRTAAPQSVLPSPVPTPTPETTPPGFHPALLGLLAATLVLFASRFRCLGLRLTGVIDCIIYLLGGSLAAWMYATLASPPPSVVMIALVGMAWLYFVRTLFVFADVLRKAIADYFNSGGGLV